MSSWGSSSPFRSCDGLIKRVESNDPNCKDLFVLPSKIFGAAEVARLCSVLERRTKINTHLISLNASGHYIEPSSLKRLGSAISRTLSRQFVSVSVGDSKMGDDGLSAFCDGLREGNHSLLHLDLSFKGIGPSGLRCLVQSISSSSSLQLKSLNLSRNESIGDAKELVLASSEGLQLGEFAIQVLDLSNCNISTTLAHELLPILRVRSLSVGEEACLNLSGNPIGAEGTNALSQSLPTITSLNLSGCDLGDEGLAVLKDLINHTCKLRSIDLSKNNIGSSGLTTLTTCLSSNEEGEKALSTLERLDLNGNNIDLSGIRTFSEVVTKNPLQYLDFSETDCGAEGACLLVYCASEVRLYKTNLGSTGFSSLARSFRERWPRHLQQLDLACNDASEPAVLELLKSILDTLKDDESRRESLQVRLSSLVVGGNEGGLRVDEIARQIQLLRPKLDIARDKSRKG